MGPAMKHRRTSLGHSATAERECMKTAMKHLLPSTVLLLAFTGATRAQDSTLKERAERAPSSTPSRTAGEIRYRFLDIPWASQASKVRAELTSHGFTVSATDRDGDI